MIAEHLLRDTENPDVGVTPAAAEAQVALIVGLVSEEKDLRGLQLRLVSEGMRVLLIIYQNEEQYLSQFHASGRVADSVYLSTGLQNWEDKERATSILLRACSRLRGNNKPLPERSLHFLTHNRGDR